MKRGGIVKIIKGRRQKTESKGKMEAELEEWSWSTKGYLKYRIQEGDPFQWILWQKKSAKYSQY